MRRILLVSLLLGLFVMSCSKKDQSQTIKSNTQSQNTVQNTPKTQADKFYIVKGAIGDVKKDEMVDFSWIENGNEVKLSDSKGKVILINFWATWCPPCRKEIPDLSAISNELKDDKFKMFGVSIDENRDALEKFLSTNNISYTVLHDQTEVVSKYMSATGGTQNFIPQTYIIDKNGKIVEVIIGSKSKAEFLKLINKYL